MILISIVNGALAIVDNVQVRAARIDCGNVQEIKLVNRRNSSVAGRRRRRITSLKRGLMANPQGGGEVKSNRSVHKTRSFMAVCGWLSAKCGLAKRCIVHRKVSLTFHNCPEAVCSSVTNTSPVSFHC